jgi:uncharacterized protein YceH (UPF0502 family)
VSAPANLSSSEVRVLGCLLEKQRTTPDAYPLSLNALRLACNQSTSREPVVDYDDAIVRDALHRLERRGLTRLASGAGSRATKYRHLLAEALPMEGGEQAIMCVLMLRGPQTPGELKQRTERMHAFGDLAGVHETLECLIARELVARQGRRPGHKEERYAQLLSSDEDQPSAHGQATQPVTSAEPYVPDGPSAGSGATAASGPSADSAASGRAAAPDERDDLRERVARLEREVAELRAAIRHPVS